MSTFPIVVQVEVRHPAEAAEVKAALEYVLGLNGATGALNLYDELQSSQITRLMVKGVMGSSQPSLGGPKTAITLAIAARDDREAKQVKNALEHLLGLNGAVGILKLFERLQGSKEVLRAVQVIADKFRRKAR